MHIKQNRTIYKGIEYIRWGILEDSIQSFCSNQNQEI